MTPRLTLRQYRRIDLILFLLILLVSETVIVRAATAWFPAQPYTVSAAAAVTAIVMMRWGPWAAIHAGAAGLLFCFLSGGSPRQYLIYGLGNLLSLAALFLFYIPGRREGPTPHKPAEPESLRHRAVSGKERVREDAFLTVCFALLTQLLMHCGRALVALLLGTAPAVCTLFFTTDALSGLFTAVILWIARRLDGIFEDQVHYLLRIQNEEKEGREEI